MRKFYKTTLGIATAALLVGGLAACATPAAEPAASPTESASEEAEPMPLASIPELAGVDTQVALDAGFLEAITGLGLTPGVTGTATLDGATGTLSFPITGGNVDYYDPAESYRPYVQGSVSHDGSGITLTGGDKVVGLSDFRIDPGTSQLFGTVTLNGELVGNDVYIFNLDGSTLNPLAEDADGNAVLEGTTVLVSPDAAGLLNETFGVTAVTDTLVVGIAKITVKAA